MNLLVVVVITLCVELVYGQSSSCITTEGKKLSGECVSIFKCAPLLSLVNKLNKTNEDLMLLTKSHCGHLEKMPKVCCPKQVEPDPSYSVNGTCTTPDGKPGKCISVYSCPHVANKLRPPVSEKNKDFVKNSGCQSPEKFTVCCGPPPVDARSDSCQAKMTAFPLDTSSECCGNGASIGSKITGGFAASIDAYPWTAIIDYEIKEGGMRLMCGGALISGKYVLTAAHCITGSVLDMATPKIVRLGEYNVTHNGMDCVLAPGGGLDCTDGDTRIAIEKTIPHPKYSPENPSKWHDIGLIRLKEIAPYTDFIRPVCLPAKDLTQPENIPPSFSLYAVGWGATEQRLFSDIKVHVNMLFVSQEKCQPAYTRFGRNITLWKGQLCAGGVENIDTCRGDSGGPLVYENQNRLFELVGIISFGSSPCGKEGVPGVYSNVYKYLDWIKSTIVS